MALYIMEYYGPDPNSFNSEVYNPAYFQFLSQPVTYETLRSTAVTNIAGTTSYIQSKEINLAGVVVQNGNLEVNSDIIGNASTTITAGVAQIPNITTLSDNLVIQASSPNNIYLGYNDGEGHLYVNTNTQSNMYIDGGDVVLNNVNQKLRMGTNELFFNETNKWTATELIAGKININNVDLEAKLTTLDLDIVQNKNETDAHFIQVEQTAQATQTQLENTIATVNSILTTNLNSVNTNLSQQIDSNQALTAAHFITVETTAETNRSLLQANIDAVNSQLISSIDSVNSSLTQTISQNKLDSDTRFASVEATAIANKTLLQTSIGNVNNNLTNSISSLNASLTQTINQNKTEAETRMTAIETTAIADKAGLQTAIASLDSNVNSKIDANKSMADAALDTLSQTKADITFVETKVAQLVNGAPELLNTLSELATAIGNDNNFSSSMVSLIGTKADKTYTDSQVSTLQSAINTKATINYVNTELDKKVDNTSYNTYQAQVDAAINSKVSNSDYTIQVAQLQSDINAKASSALVSSSVSSLQGQIDIKASSTDLSSTAAGLQSQIDTKATSVYVETQLELKANTTALLASTTSLQSQIDTKATTTYVDTQLGIKADKSELQTSTANLQSQIDTKAGLVYVDGQLSLKANANDVSATAASLQAVIDTKSSISYVNEQLLGKVNVSDAQTTTTNLTSLINQKASITYTDGQLALKADKSYVDDQLGSTSSQIALKADKTYLDTKFTELVGAAPSTLDTLQELANAIAEDANFSVTIINQIAAKASKTYVDGEVSSLQSQINNRALTSYVNQQLALKGDITYVNDQLALKSNVSDVAAELATKANSSDLTALTSVVSGKSDASYVNSALALKADASDLTALTTIVSGKSDTSYVNSALATKANASDLTSLTSVVSAKSDTSYVNTEIASAKSYADSAITTATAGLATQIYVDNKTQMVKDDILGGASTAYDTLLELQTALSNNSDAVSALTNQIGTKASTTYVDNAVSTLHANVQTDLNAKASITYVDAQIAALPAPPSLTGYATESYVNTAIQNAQTNGVDLTAYATKTYVDTSISDLSGNYASKTYVDTTISDLSGNYASKTYVDTSISDLSGNYASKTYVDTSISDLSGNYASKTYVNNAVANVSVDLTGYATETYVGTAVSAVKSEILGGAGAAYDTLQELNALIQSGDSSVSTALSSQIALKANDNVVVHLTGTETIGGIKIFSNNVTVPSINNISSTTLGYMDATSSIQTQINAKANANAVVDLSSTQTIGGAKTFSSNVTVPSLNNITNTTLGYLSGVTSAIQTQINAKANSNAVVDLSTAQTIGGAKTFSSNVTVPSLNNITSTTLGYLDATSSIQTQLNAKATDTAVVHLTGAETITGNKTFNNINSYQKSVEQMQTLTITSNATTLDFSANSAIGYVVPPAATNFTLNVTNVPLTSYSGGSFTITLLINTSTNKAYANALNVNGTAQTIRYCGGSTAVSISSAVWAIQTITVLVLPGTTTVGGVLSSVTQWY